MSDDRQLSPESVDLLLQLLELPEPLLAAAGAESHPFATEQLIGAGLLTPHDYEDVVASVDDHDDVPVALTWCEQAGSFTYFSPTAGLIQVSHDQRLRRRINVGQMLATMTIGFDLPRGEDPFELLNGLLWEIGDARLANKKARVPIWFARRLWDKAVQQQVAEVALLRPNTRQRVVLTSSRASRVRDVALPGAAVVSVHEVLSRPDCLVVDPHILAARLGGIPMDSLECPITLSPDGTQLRINGNDPILFKGKYQLSMIRKLVAAYKDGRGLRLSELTHLGSLRRAFGEAKWALLSPYLKSANKLWKFDP